MNKQFTYKQKFYILLVIGFLLILISYKRSFRYTIRDYRNSVSLKNKFQNMKSGMKDIDSLKRQSDYLNQIISEKDYTVEKIQQEILSFCAKYSNCKIIDLKAPYIYSDDLFTTNSFFLTLEGSYNQLSKIIYAFETSFRFAKIVSVNYHTYKDYRRQKKMLRVRIIFQSYNLNTKNRQIN